MGKNAIGDHGAATITIKKVDNDKDKEEEEEKEDNDDKEEQEEAQRSKRRPKGPQTRSWGPEAGGSLNF